MVNGVSDSSMEVWLSSSRILFHLEPLPLDQVWEEIGECLGGFVEQMAEMSECEEASFSASKILIFASWWSFPRHLETMSWRHVSLALMVASAATWSSARQFKCQCSISATNGEALVILSNSRCLELMWWITTSEAQSEMVFLQASLQMLALAKS
jgi:hypothetical protein